MDSLFIVMPAYNEEANIEAVIRQWYPVLEGKCENSRLVIADSGSCDKTHSIFVNLQKELNQLVILEDTGKQHGPKVIAIYNYAIKQGTDFIFQTDSDGQTNPNEFCNKYHQQKQFLLFSGNGHRCTPFYEQTLNFRREQRQNGLILHPDQAYSFLCFVVFRYFRLSMYKCSIFPC